MDPIESRPSPAQIETWIASEEAALNAIRAQITPLFADAERIEARVVGLRQLLATYESEVTPLTISRGTAGRPAGSMASSVAARVRDQVREILLAAGEPMHINAIHSVFLERGWVVPGAGRPANITAHLSHATDIISPTRGYYRLLADGEAPPSRSRAATATTRATRRRRNSEKK